MAYTHIDKLNGKKPRKKVNPQLPRKEIVGKNVRPPRAAANNYNHDFLNDKLTFKNLFDRARHKHVPQFFIQLSNSLKDLNKRDFVFDCVHMYLHEGYSISMIREEMKKGKPPRRKSKQRVWPVKR